MAPRVLETPRDPAHSHQRRNAVDEVRIPPAGDGFYAAGIRRRTHDECIADMHAEEERLGRKMSDLEREAFARGFHAPSYRAEIRRLMTLGVEPPEENEA
jgi:hypothetical protein